MRINRRFLTWGFFFVLVGAIPLAVRAGWIGADQVGAWWNLWPLVIVGIGVGLVLSRTPFEVLGGLLVAGVFGLMVGAFLAVGGQGFPGVVCGGAPSTNQLDSRSGAFDGPAAVDIEFNCGTIILTAAPGSDWSFDGRGDEDRAPTISADGDSLRIRSPERGVSFPFNGTRDDWEVGIPTDAPVALALQLNAGEAMVEPGAASLRDVNVQVNFGTVRLDLAAAAALGSVDVQNNFGSTDVSLPNVSTAGDIQLNFGTIRLCTPPDAGLRIRTGDNPFSSNDFGGKGLERTGNTWETPGYGSAAVRIDLDVESNFGTISLNPGGGCDG